MPKIILIPTSHIASQSVKKVKEVIEKEKPDCVAVELDMNRLMSFKQKQASTLETIKALGPATFLIFWTMKKLQTWLGNKVGILPGSEMLTAVKIAQQNKIKVALIDQNIAVTFTNIQKIPFKEKAKLMWFFIRGVTIGLVLSKIKKDKIDLSKLPQKDLIEEAMLMIKTEFPHLFKALVTDRDRYMVKNLKNISKHFEKIVVVIGAGHYKGMKKMLK